jgi:hypothetical protein
MAGKTNLGLEKRFALGNQIRVCSRQIASQPNDRQNRQSHTRNTL